MSGNMQNNETNNENGNPSQPPPRAPPTSPEGEAFIFWEMRARGWGKTMMQMEEDRRNDEGR